MAYNRFRYYDPELGSYISQDPIGLSWNNSMLYAYVMDTNIWLDVFGLKYEPGRRGKQQRLKELLTTEPNLPKHVIGWLKQERNKILRKHKNRNGTTTKYYRNPPGYQLAHKRGYEARLGYDYSYTKLNTTANHGLQHKYDNNGFRSKLKK